VLGGIIDLLLKNKARFNSAHYAVH
jgi:hypothetical protein